MARYVTRIDEIPWGQDLTTSIALNGSSSNSTTALPENFTLPASPCPTNKKPPRPEKTPSSNPQVTPPPLEKFSPGMIVCTRQDMTMLVVFFLVVGLFFYARSLSERISNQEQTIRVIVTALIAQASSTKG